MIEKELDDLRKLKLKQDFPDTHFTYEPLRLAIEYVNFLSNREVTYLAHQVQFINECFHYDSKYDSEILFVVPKELKHLMDQYHLNHETMIACFMVLNKRKIQ